MEDYNAQWRASAHEAVPYTEDLPECLSVFPELLDGAIGQGKAPKVTIEIELNETTGILKVIDNGKGVTNPKRLLTWASKQSTELHHRYGHGSKKCLTKWSKDYSTAKWYVRFRTCDKRGKYSSLTTFKAPFRGLDDNGEEDAEDETTLIPSGTEWCIDFNRSILGNFNSAQELLNIIKEIIRTRYSAKYLSTTEFIITVKEGDKIITESSKDSTKNWKTFEECLQDEITNGNAVIINNTVHPFNDGINMRYTLYHLKINGNLRFDLKLEFPTYGAKNIKCARLHIALDGRTIEIPYIWKFFRGREGPHNDYNGLFGIVNFEGIGDSPIIFDSMPTPCTTKVSFYNNCPNYRKMNEIICDIHDTLKSEIKPKPEPKLEPVKPEPVKPEPVKPKPEPKLEPKLEPVKPKPEPKLVKPKPKPAPELVKPKPVKPEPVKSESDSESDSLPKPLPKLPRPPKGLRVDVWHKYIGREIAKHKCLCCKIETIEQFSFECGHVLAVSNGGSNTIENLRPICSKCNKSMGSKNMIDYVVEHQYYIG